MEGTHESLPKEILCSILLRLPVKSLVRFKCVTKSWLAEIASQYFTKLYNHINNQPQPQNSGGLNPFLFVSKSTIFTYDFSGARVVCDLPRPPGFFTYTRYEIAGFCNDLLCLEGSASGKFSLYNPTTQAYKVLPDLNLKISNRIYDYFDKQIGFGYDQKSNDFKILQLVLGKAYIYRLRNDSWDVMKLEEKYNYREFLPLRKQRHMVVSNNALHWKLGSSIIAFDLGAEEFYSVPLADGIISCADLCTYWEVADLRGYLHIVKCKFTEQFEFPCYLAPNNHILCVEIWIMKEYGVKESWSKLLEYSSDEFQNLFVRNSTHPIEYQGELRPQVYAYSSNQRKILVGLELHPKNFSPVI